MSQPEPAIYIAPREHNLVQIYVRVLKQTPAHESWLSGHGFRAITVTAADLQKLLRKAKA
ncbi:MAG TPA: hypothetical protein VN087_02665 [Verrucomicrobiae bacterium]|nr:hypothetical protein [Verrucomicrobiae bacterium]